MRIEDATLGTLMRQNRITHEVLADCLSLSVQTVHNWARRRTAIPARHLRSVCDALRTLGVQEEALRQLVIAELQGQGIEPWMIIPVEDRTPERSVTLIVWRMDGLSKASVLASICRASLERMGYRCLIIDLGGNALLVDQAIDAVIRLNGIAAGLFMPGLGADPAAHLEKSALRLLGTGTSVLFGGFWDDPERLPDATAAIRWDVKALAALAADELQLAGHTSVGAIVGGEESVHPTIIDAFIEAISRRNMALTSLVWYRDSPVRVREGMTSLIANTTGVFTATAPAVLPLVEALYHVGKGWPEDISILLSGGPEATPQLGTRPFTTVALPLARMGVDAARLLDGVIREPNSPQASRYKLYSHESIMVTNRDDGSLGPPRSTLQRVGLSTPDRGSP